MPRAKYMAKRPPRKRPVSPALRANPIFSALNKKGRRTSKEGEN